MLYRAAAVAILACVLGGCTEADWDHTFSYVGIGDQPSSPPPAAAATVSSAPLPAPQSDSWCDQAAKAAAQESREQGFDEATQRRQAESARRQCQHN